MKKKQLDTQEQQFLLELARKAITQYLSSGNTLHIDESSLPSEILMEERAVFVTLNKDKNLRGCIGHLSPTQELFKDVIENAISAAIHDPRFQAVTKEELSNIDIEISVLSIPEKYEYENVEALVEMLEKEKPGIILKKDFYQATFLPQVWEQLPDTESFLSHLCSKAGLPPNAWKNGDLEIQTYMVQKFDETKEA